MAGNTPIPLTITRLDDRRIELQGSLAAVPTGVAHIHFYQTDTEQHRRIADEATLAIAPTPAQVDEKKTPVAYIGDRFVFLTGNGFDGVSGMRIGPNLYSKTPNSQADAACFSGPPVGGVNVRDGSVATAVLVPTSGGSGEAFSLRLAGKRPVLTSVAVAPTASVHHAADALTISLESAPLPRRFEVRIRQAPQDFTPCDALQDDATAVIVPASDLRRDSASVAELALHVGDLLHDDAFGTLQVQVVDSVTQRASDWINIPGQFSE